MKKTNHNNKAEKRMKVSFDLDEVLFVSPKTHKTEPRLPFPFYLIFRERLRLGTPRLIKELHILGYEIWVYTSSYRSESYIRNLFKLYNVKFDGIINAQRHLREVQAGKTQILPQKLPNFYQISLHIDDEEVVASYGKENGFDVFQLNAQDDEWEQKIIDRVFQIQKKAIAKKLM